MALLVPALLLTVIVGCTDSTATGPDSPPITPRTPAESGALVIEIEPSSLRMLLGDVVTLTAAARDYRGEPVDSAAFRWTSSDSSVARVDSDGRVEALSDGSASITATAAGKSATVPVVVREPAESVAVESPPEAVAIGEQVMLSVTVLSEDGDTIPRDWLTWSSSDEDVAEVDSVGRMTALDAGTSTITARIDDRSDSVEVTVVEGDPLGSYELVWSPFPERSDPASLEEDTLSGDAYIHLDPSEVDSVRYHLDGQSIAVRRVPPFDFRGSSGGEPFPWDTRSSADGTHTIEAEVHAGTSTATSQATFEVRNDPESGSGGGSAGRESEGDDPTSPPPADTVGPDGVPLDLMGGADAVPEEGIVTLRGVDVPPDKPTARLALTVFDPDAPDEGELYVNGEGPVNLFPGVDLNNDTTVLNVDVEAAWFVDGDNELRFRHVRTVGYRIVGIELSFVEGEEETSSSPPPPAPDDTAGAGVDGLPLDLMGGETAVPEEGIVTLRGVEVPPDKPTARLALTVFDPDAPDEGELYVNGQGPLDLFPGVDANDDTTVVEVDVEAAWFTDGDNELRFRHVRTAGYRILGAELSFAEAEEETSPPPPPPSDDDGGGDTGTGDGGGDGGGDTGTGGGAGDGFHARTAEELQALIGDGSPARPGDTVWVHGGRYEGAFVSELQGTAAAPIVVRAVPGERATLAADGPFPDALTVRGSHTWIWGLEVTNDTPNGTVAPQWTEGAGVVVREGPGHRLIHVLAQGAWGNGIGWWTPATGGEIYGTISVGNGRRTNAPSAGQRGYGIYAQSSSSLAVEESLFGPQGGSWSVHVYAQTPGMLESMHFTGVVAWGNEWSFLGAGTVSHDLRWEESATYGQGFLLGGNPQYVPGTRNAVIRDNIFVTQPERGISRNSRNEGTVWQDNEVYTTESFPDTVIVRAVDRYEPGRAHVAVYNSSRAAEVTVSLPGGGSYEIRPAEQPFGTPVVVCGAECRIPMNGHPFGAFLATRP